DLVARDDALSSYLREKAFTLPNIVLIERQLCDLELIINGGFSPLEGEKDYQSIVDTLRLADGTLFPIPIILDISKEDIELSLDQNHVAPRLGPRNFFGYQSRIDLKTSPVDDVYTPDRVKEAMQFFGADDPAHPLVGYLRNR
ncbi:uncharacterized protein LACBIDRAFT_232595, partial [Laccaria bicolor S238N-H82]